MTAAIGLVLGPGGPAGAVPCLGAALPGLVLVAEGFAEAGERAETLTDFRDLERVRLTSSSEVSWEQVGPGSGGGLPVVALHPTNPEVLFFFNDMGSCYRSEDGGQSYRSINQMDDGYFGVLGPLWTATFSAADPDLVYADGDKGVFKSTDYGETWECISRERWPDMAKGQPRAMRRRPLLLPLQPPLSRGPLVRHLFSLVPRFRPDGESGRCTVTSGASPQQQVGRPYHNVPTIGVRASMAPSVPYQQPR